MNLKNKNCKKCEYCSSSKNNVISNKFGYALLICNKYKEVISKAKELCTND